MILEVKRHADGSGDVHFDFNYPGVVGAPQIPAGYLTAAPPSVAVAASACGPAAALNLEFDNVTIDFPRPVSDPVTLVGTKRRADSSPE